MNAIPAVLYYFIAFHPGAPVEPISWGYPMSRADCVWFEKHSSDGWCQAIHLRKPNKEH